MTTIPSTVAGSSTDTDEDDDEDDEDETTTSSHTQTTTKYLTHMADDSATALFISHEQGIVYITVCPCMDTPIRNLEFIVWSNVIVCINASCRNKKILVLKFE